MMSKPPDAKAEICFGRTADQQRHAVRHIVEAGYDAEIVKSAIRAYLEQKASVLPVGLYLGEIKLAGTAFSFSAFPLPGGMINVGRITVGSAKFQAVARQGARGD